MAKLLAIQNYEGELYGIMSIAAYVKDRHKIEVSLGSSREIASAFRRFQPHVVGIHALTKDHAWALRTAELIKSLNINTFVLVGGTHPTFYTRILDDPHVNAIAVGEAEKPLSMLLDSFDDGRHPREIPSLWLKGEEGPAANTIGSFLEKDELPIPDRSIYRKYPQIFLKESIEVMCSRGCPYNCNFCASRAYRTLYGKKTFRLRSIASIMEEITQARQNKSVKNILFQDDIFGLDKKWLREFLGTYRKEIDLPFYCLLRCDVITPALVDMLKDAGCYQVGIGVESGNPQIRNELLNKNLSNKKIVRAASILREKKVGFHTFNMLGLPGEDIRSAFTTLRFNIALRPDIGWSSIFQPYPGSKYFTDEVEPSIICDDFNRFKINHPYNKDYRKIQRLQKFFMLTVRFPFLRPALPFLIRLPLDGLYDRISRSAWGMLYGRKLNK